MTDRTRDQSTRLNLFRDVMLRFVSKGDHTLNISENSPKPRMSHSQIELPQIHYTCHAAIVNPTRMKRL